MSSAKTILLVAATSFTVTLVSPHWASAQVMGREASECDIAASLNIEKPGCPAPSGQRVRTRGLAIGNADVMPPSPPPAPESNMAPAATSAPMRVEPTPAPTQRAQPSTAQPRTQAPRQQVSAAFKINFEFGSTRLTGESRDILDRVGAVLNSPAASSIRFRIVGHTDAVGSASTNQDLSRRRAYAVVDYLMEVHGIARNRLEAVGMGESDLLNPRNPRGGENRRVEIINLGS